MLTAVAVFGKKDEDSGPNIDESNTIIARTHDEAEMALRAIGFI